MLIGLTSFWRPAWHFSRDGRAWRVALEYWHLRVDNEPQREAQRREIEADRAKWEAERPAKMRRLEQLSEATAAAHDVSHEAVVRARAEHDAYLKEVFT